MPKRPSDWSVHMGVCVTACDNRWCNAQWLLMKVRNHGGQNCDRLRDFVLVKFVYILWFWKTIECNYGVESVGIRVGGWAEPNERVKEKKPTSWYPSDILLIIDTRPCGHVPFFYLNDQFANC